MADDDHSGFSEEDTIEGPELFDFLYKDSQRISSFYAQLFDGRVSSVEKSETVRSAKETLFKGSGKASLKFAGGEIGAENKSIRDHQNLRKEILDPHDRATTDVLSYLVSGGHVADDYSTAPNGSLVIVDGTLTFIDKSLVDIARIGYEAETAKNKDKITILIKQLLAKLVTPSIFLVQADDDQLVTGTLNDEFMLEPISSYYYKHGAEGLSGVTVIGIKESAELPLRLSEVSLIGASLPILKVLAEMFIPAEAVRVTPICIYRRLL